MGSEIGTYCILALLSHVVSLSAAVQVGNLLHQVLSFLWGEQTREKQITFTVKFIVLLGCEFHGKHAPISG